MKLGNLLAGSIDGVLCQRPADHRHPGLARRDDKRSTAGTSAPTAEVRGQDQSQRGPVETSRGMHDSVDPIRSILIFGSSFICLGVLALVAAVIQHTRILRRL